MQNHFDQFGELTNKQIHFVAIDGLDGSGKGTLAEEIVNLQIELGRNALLIDFPQYSTKWGKILKYLLTVDDKGLTLPERMAVYALNRLECVDALINEGLKFKEETVVVFDRFPTSNILTIAYYLAKNELKDVELTELEESLKAKMEVIKKYINEMFVLDDEFLKVLALETVKVCIPKINPRISMERLENDTTRDGADSYENLRVQIIADYLYGIAATYHENILILEQEGRSPKEIALDIVKLYGLNKSASNLNSQRTKIKLHSDPEISDRMKEAMNRLLEKFPRLKSLLNL